MLIRCIVVLLILLQTGCVTTAITGARMIYNRNDISTSFENQDVSFQAMRALQNNPDLKSSANLTTASFNHLLLVAGQVPTNQLKSDADSIARNVPGVKHVYNGITVGPNETAWQTTQDSWITSKLLTEMVATNGLSPSNFKVITEDSVIYLLGAAPKDQVTKVIQIAKNIDGVKKVVNLMYYIQLEPS